MGEKEAIIMASVLVSIFALAAGTNSIVTLFRNIFPRERTEKRDVTINSGSPTKQEFDSHVEANEKEFDALKDQFDQLRQDASARSSNVFRRMEENKDTVVRDVTCVKESVAALEAEMKLTNQRMSEMNGKLDRLIERKH